MSPCATWKAIRSMPSTWRVDLTRGGERTMLRLQTTLLSLLLLTSIAPAARAQSPSRSGADAARAEIQAAFGFVPRFVRAVPDRALPGAWLELKSLQINPQ